MVMSKAATVKAYLAELPPERRAVVAAVRAVVRKHLPKGYKETMNLGMICYEVPLARYPDTYNGQPLCFAGLAAQKNYNALYLTAVYADPAKLADLKAGFDRAGKTLDMGKSCLRFKAADDLALDAIGKVIAATPVEAFIATYEAGRKQRPRRGERGT